MKVIIAGSRSIGCDDKDQQKQLSECNFIEDVFTDCPISGNISEIVSGTARGVDKLGEQYGFDNDISVARFPADWNLLGKRAGHVRNAEMGDYADAAIILWDGVSPGSKGMFNIMKKLEKPCYLYYIKDEQVKKKGYYNEPTK